MFLLLAGLSVQSQAANIRLSQSEISLYVGQSLPIEVIGGQKVVWSTRNKAIAVVNRTGKVTAKKKGTTVITAKVGKKKLTCKVTVKNVADPLYIKIGTHTLSATMVNNSSTRVFTKWLVKKGETSIQMSDYAEMEKVGSLEKEFPTNDKNIKTTAGDLILYEGNQFVIYYDTNEWEFTRLGKLQDVSGEELKEILGDGDVTITLSLEP